MSKITARKVYLSLLAHSTHTECKNGKEWGIVEIENVRCNLDLTRVEMSNHLATLRELGMYRPLAKNPACGYVQY